MTAILTGISDFFPEGTPSFPEEFTQQTTTLMPTFYYDLVGPTGTVLEDEEFTSIDRARDIAFEIAQELGLDVSIRENFGAASNVVEVVEG